MTDRDSEESSTTRDTILQAAYVHFRDQGYHGTSMRQIAESSGIALGGIYNHFDSKEQIFSTVLIDYHPAHEVIPAVMQSDSSDMTDFVRYAAHIILTTLNKRPDFLNLMFIELVEFRSERIPSRI
jgi:AcrR family transcriptional regulator